MKRTPPGDFTTVKCTFREAPDIAASLPKNEKGEPLPLEIGCMNAFIGTPLASSLEVPTETTSNADLPDLSVRHKAQRTFRENIRVGTQGPALYYAADATITLGRDQAICLHYPAIARPAHGYIFIAGYFMPTSGDAPRCYFVESIAFDKTRDPLDQIENVVRSEIEALVKGRRRQPAWLIRPPLLARHTIELADGAVAFTREWPEGGDTSSGRQILTRDNSRLNDLSRADAEHLRAWIAAMEREVSLPKGARPDFTSVQLSAAFCSLLRLSRTMLEQLPKDWPPFRNRASASRFVRRHCSASPPQLRVIVDHFLKGQRRPTAAQFAMRVLASSTGLTSRRLQQLVRK